MTAEEKNLESAEIEKRMNYVFANPAIESYRKELAADMKVTYDNIREKAITASAVRAKWLTYLFKEKETLLKLDAARKHELDKAVAASTPGPTMLMDIKRADAAEKSEKIAKINEYREWTRQTIDYLQLAMNILNDFGYQIKNMTELLKMEAS